MEKVQFIEKDGYEFVGFMGDEEDVINQLGEYDDGNISDAIFELADGAVPVYYSELWEHGQEVSDYYEEARMNGLLEGIDSLEKALQSCYYEYYSQLLYNNLETWAKNEVIDRINEFLNTLTAEQVKQLDMDDIEDEIETRVEGIDRFDDIDDTAEEVKQYINEALGIEEEEEG